MKTLTERLEYGRSMLRTFWENEIRLVQKAMDFRFPAQITFDRLLTDEVEEKRLLLQLVDRDLISVETVQEMFGLTTDIEEVRIRREQRRRAAGTIPPKASPYHDPQQDFGLKKIFAQQGTVTPSEVGLELDEGAKDEKTLVEQQGEQTVKQSKIQLQGQQQQNDHQFRTEKLQLRHGVHPNQLQQQTPTGVSGQGRPKQSGDTQKRKQKTVKPRTSAAFIEALSWAEEAQAKIARLVGPALLKSVAKKTMRELTEEEGRNFESFKFGLLCQIPFGKEFDQKVIANALKTPLAVPGAVNKLLRAAVTKYVETNGREPSVEVTRRFQASTYALFNGNFDEESDNPDDGGAALS